MGTVLLTVLMTPAIVWGWTATVFFILDYIKSRKN
jgi:hypothetical protein